MERPFAWRPVVLIAAALIVILLLLSPFYGYHRDELYFRLLADHPAWGYVDQPPLTPMLAKAAITLFGDTLTAIRVAPALCMAVLVVLTALITRELGGGRTAQVLAAAGIGTGAFTLIAGHSLLTLSADLPLWAAAILFLLRALTRDPRWWLAAGAVIGAATFNRHLIVLLVIGLAVGLVTVGPRRVLGSPWLWAGAGLAVLVALPNLIFQVGHDWPQLKMAAALGENKGGEYRLLFVPMQILLFGPVVAVLGWFGWVRIWRDERIRALALAYPVAAALTLISGGRFDYAAGLIVLLFAAGCAAMGERRTAGAEGKPVAAGGRMAGAEANAARALAINGLLCPLLALPLIPVSWVAATPVPAINEVARESIGWPRFAERVTAVLRTLPPQEQATAAILTGSYGEAGMLHRAGLPRVYSGHNQLHLYGPPPESATTVVAVKLRRTGLLTKFATCDEIARTDNGVGVDNEFQDLPIFICRGLKMPWRQAWPDFQHYS